MLQGHCSNQIRHSHAAQLRDFFLYLLTLKEIKKIYCRIFIQLSIILIFSHGVCLRVGYRDIAIEIALIW